MSKRKNVDEHNESHGKHLKVKPITFLKLFIACKFNNLRIVKAAIQQGVDFNETDEEGRTVFYAACCNGHLEIVKELINQRVDIEKPDKHGRTPFYAACQWNHIEVVRELIAQRVDMEKPQQGWTPFYSACFNGNLDVVDLLCNKITTSELRKNLWIHDKESHILIKKELCKRYFDKIKWLMFGQQQPDSPLSVLHRDVLQDISKTIKEKIFL